MADSHKHQTYNLRMPDERRAWLKQRAEANNRSINAEVNFILEYFKKLEDEGKVPKMA